MIALIIVALISSAASARCPGIFFNNKCHEVDILKEGINNIHQIVYNNNDDTLYFTYDLIATVPTRGLGYLNINTLEAGIIDGIRNATGVTIDQRRNRIYVGGADGLYFLHENKIPEKLPVQETIQHLFYKDIVYFVNNRKEAFKFDYGVVTPLQELYGIAVDKILVDDDFNLFFLQDRKLSRVKLGTRAVNTHERYTVDAMATDFNYKPFICTTTGVFVYNKYKYALDKVSNIVDLKHLTFNRNGDPIYVVIDKIVRLRYNSVSYINNLDQIKLE